MTSRRFTATDATDWPGLCAAKAGALIHVGCGPVTVAQRARRPVWLATPYSREVIGADGAGILALSVDVQVLAALEAARLMRVGVPAVSPIVLSAEMCHADRGLDPLDHSAWLAWCAPLMAACGSVVVPDIPGW